MQEKDKHKIYSKEDLLKILKEGKSAPADMDAFEQEALEGLRLLDNPAVLDALDKQVGDIVEQEKKKEKNKKGIYYFSAAASLLLLIGLVFVFKNSLLKEENKPIASVEKAKEEDTAPSLSTTPPPHPRLEAEEPKLREKNKIVSVSKEQQHAVFPASSPVMAETKESIQENNPPDETIALTKNDNYAGKPGNEGQKENKQEQKDIVVTGSVDMTSTVNKEEAKQTRNVAQPTQMAVQASMPMTSVVTPAESDIPAKKNKANLFYANDKDKKATAEKYKEPAFIGGDSAFTSYVKQNLKISSRGVSGLIVLKFMVNKNGTAENIEVTRPLNNCNTCSEDAINLIKSVKKWQPAIMNGDTIAAPKKISLPYN